MLYLIVAAYLLIGVVYSVVTPLFEVSDELWHYPTVQYLAEHSLRLPPQDAENIGPWRQEGSQPPLYYLIAALLIAPLDTSDMALVLRQNPHADIGTIRPDGNLNMIVHNAEREAFPWRGTALAVHVVRFFSLLLGLGTVLVTYQLAREVFPERPVIAPVAAALNAFLPMFLFISASVNNDNLSNLLGNLLTLLLVRLLKATRLPGARAYVVIGAVTGAGLLSKLNIGFLLPFVALSLLIASRRLRSRRPLVQGGLISGGVTAVLAGWWYWRNWQLYGDPTGLNRFLEIVGRRLIPATPEQLWSERESFLRAYWGFFGGVNLPMPDGVYLAFDVAGGLALVGAALFIATRIVQQSWTNQRWLPAALTVLWPLVTFAAFLRWTAVTPASQGRLVFGALSSISLWMAVGLVWWLPRRLRGPVPGAVAGYFAAVAALVPFLVIAPAYRPPQPIVVADEPQSLFEAPGHGAVALLDARLITRRAYPADYVTLEADWQITQRFERDWSLFVHLTTPDGVIVGQRDVYPAGGLLATSDMAADFAWENPVTVLLPPNAYAPLTLTANLGWYHLPTGERLQLADGGETVTIGQVEVQPIANELGVPNPLSINFSDQIELVGYELSDLSPRAGESAELTLYWRGLRDIARDYVVFAHIIDPQSNAIHAGSDAQPAGWSAPTSDWQRDTLVQDTHTLALNPDTPPGIYELEVGLYSQEADGSLPRLRIFTGDGGQARDFTYLSRVRVLPPAAEE